MDRSTTRRVAGLGDTSSAGYAIVFLPRSGTSAELRPLALPEVGEATIGREPPAQLVLPDDTVSRKHARVTAGSPPEIEDLGSTNGTKVMGRRLAPGERAALPHGAIVELGSVIGYVQPSTIADAWSERGQPDLSHGRATLPPMPARPATSQGGRSAIVEDATMRRLYELVDVIAPSKLGILILGETGAGKDVYAETLHRRSPRAGAPFLRLNCAALPENLLEAELFGYERGAFTGAVQAKPGLFESADGGTVFLDEIGEMPLVTQAKLLRVLESGEVLRIGSLKPRRVDVRFVSATHRDLEALSSTGQFRSDLYFRLNGVSVTLPPLRRRPDDVLPLARFFLREVGATSTLTEAAEQSLVAYRWPGNIRELKNVVERAALLARGGSILPEHLVFGGSLGGTGHEAPAVQAPMQAPATHAPAMPAAAMPAPAVPPPPAATEPARGAVPIRDEFAELEKRRILETMDRCGGNQSRAAKQLGISRTTLIKRLEQYGYVRPRKGQDDE